MRIFQSKKGLEEGPVVMARLPFWMFFGIVATILALVLFHIANLFVRGTAEIPRDLEDEVVLVSRFYNSHHCFAYEDEIGVVHGGIIDIEKFKQVNMDNCFPESDVKYAYYLSLLVPPEAGSEGPDQFFGPVNTFNWVEGFASKEITEDVFVIENGEKRAAKLNIKIKDVE